MQILFYKGRKRDNPKATFLDRLICFVDGGMYSHVEFIVPVSQPVPGYVTTWGSHAMRGGVSDGLFHESEAYDIVELDSTNLGALYNNIGKLFGKYDFIGLPRTKWSWWCKPNGRYFCSSLMAASFKIEHAHYMGVEDFYQWVMNNPLLNAKIIAR